VRRGVLPAAAGVARHAFGRLPERVDDCIELAAHRRSVVAALEQRLRCFDEVSRELRDPAAALLHQAVGPAPGFLEEPRGPLLRLAWACASRSAS